MTSVRSELSRGQARGHTQFVGATVSVTKQLRARHATAVRIGRMDEAARIRSDLTAAVLEDRIADALATNDLTTDQRQRLAAILTAEEPGTPTPIGEPRAHAS